MKSTMFGIFLLAASLLSYGQTRVLTDDDYNNSGLSELTFVTEISRAQELAKKDIEAGIPFIILQGGIGPVIYTTDSLFENRFKVYYRYQGCLAHDTELATAYNFEVFKFLNKAHGKKWRKSIRRDVVGFKKWKRKKHRF